MARKSKAEIKREAEAAERAAREAAYLLQTASRGTARVHGRLEEAERHVRELTQPGGRFGQRRHEHAEPFNAPHCGWCSNIHTWRAQAEHYRAALPIAEAIEASIEAKAAELSGAKLWAWARETHPHVTREQVRDLAYTVRLNAEILPRLAAEAAELTEVQVLVRLDRARETELHLYRGVALDVARDELSAWRREAITRQGVRERAAAAARS